MIIEQHVKVVGIKTALPLCTVPCRKGTAVRSGQVFASRVQQQLNSADSGTTHVDAASKSAALQEAAMHAAADRMQQLGLEVYWQPFSSGSGANGAPHSIGIRGVRPIDDAIGSAGAATGRGSGDRGADSRGCRNLHGVLRSPRGDGKEGLLLATPLALAAPPDPRPGKSPSAPGVAARQMAAV